MKLLLLLLLFLPALALAAEPPLLPVWTKGQTWYVETRHAMVTMRGETPKPSDQLGPPQIWEYKVADIRESGQLRYYQLMARDVEAKDPRRAGLIFVSELGRSGQPLSLALQKATFESPVQGKLTRLSRDYRKEPGGPHPVLSEDSLIPADVPFFSASSTGAATITTFDVTEMMDGMPFARDVTQRVRRASPAEELLPFRGPKEPIRIRAGGDRAHDLDVLLERRSDDSIVHQLWNPAFPWFLYSRSHAGVAYLIPRFPPARPDR